MAGELVRNERRTLPATFLDTIGPGAAVIGVVAPLVLLWDGAAGRPAAGFVARSVLFLVGGAALHLKVASSSEDFAMSSADWLSLSGLGMALVLGVGLALWSHDADRP